MKFLVSQRLNRLVGIDFQWAHDGHWDWTTDVGDRHIDYVCVRILKREGQPPVLLLSLGPLMVGLLTDEISHEAKP